MYGVFTYIYHRNQPSVGKYIPYMDPVGLRNKCDIFGAKIYLYPVFVQHKDDLQSDYDQNKSSQSRFTDPGTFCKVQKGAWFERIHIFIR